MDIGYRLRELRQLAKLSQGDIEGRTGLLRCYISRIECGHTQPSVETLERWAKALGVELHQIFYSEDGKPKGRGPVARRKFSVEDLNLLALFERVPPEDRKLLIQLARFSIRNSRRK